MSGFFIRGRISTRAMPLPRSAFFAVFYSLLPPAPFNGLRGGLAVRDLFCAIRAFGFR